MKDVVEIPPEEEQNDTENNSTTTDGTINKSSENEEKKEGKESMDVENKNPLDGYEFRLKKPKHLS